jgi:Amiloride-sensitive sodium channel
VNCSGAKKSPKKVLTFDITDSAEISNIYRNIFSVLVQSNSNFEDTSKMYAAQISHIHQVMRPIIHMADVSLADLSPVQWVDQLFDLFIAFFMDWTFKRRNCYFERERKLKFFNVYTKHNFMQECLTNATIEVCECAKFFYIRELNDFVRFLWVKLLVIGDDSTQICHETKDRDCVNRIYNILFDESSPQVQQCDCLPSCSSINYNTNVHFEKFSAENNNEVEKSSISVYFDDDEFIVMRRYARFGIVTLLSNVGGLLGLFLGASVMSFIEVFYFFVIRLVNNLWWKG